MNLNTDRITHPLRLAKGSHQPGSGKGCAMNVISYINGDTKITDYPACSARPLASIVQVCNDELADSDGYLSPENSVVVLDLGWQTVGAAGVPDSVIHAWMAEVLANPEWGVIRFAQGEGVAAISNVAEMHRKVASGEMQAAWSAPRAAAWSAAESFARRAAWSVAWAAPTGSAWSAESAAMAAAWSVAAPAYAATAAAESAAAAADIVEFTQQAITCWRNLADIDDDNGILPPEDLEKALIRINR